MAPLPKYDEWKAPWEKSGKDFDAETAKKFIYDLESDKENLSGTVATHVATIAERDGKITELQGTINTKANEGLSEMEKLTKQVQDLAAAVSKPAAKVEDKSKPNKLEIALEVGTEMGLTPKQIKGMASRISGDTAEALKADAESYIEENGLGGDTDFRELDPRSRQRARSGSEPDVSGGRSAETFDPGKLAAEHISIQ